MDMRSFLFLFYRYANIARLTLGGHACILCNLFIVKNKFCVHLLIINSVSAKRRQFISCKNNIILYLQGNKAPVTNQSILRVWFFLGAVLPSLLYTVKHSERPLEMETANEQKALANNKEESRGY